MTISHAPPTCNPPPSPTEIAGAVSIIVRLLASLAATAQAAPAEPPCIYTGDPLERLRGHTKRALCDAILRGDLPGTKTTKRGYRVLVADLEVWEASRTRPRRQRSAQAAPASAPESDEQRELAEARRALASVDGGAAPRRAAR